MLRPMRNELNLGSTSAPSTPGSGSSETYCDAMMWPSVAGMGSYVSSMYYTTYDSVPEGAYWSETNWSFCSVYSADGA